jgi:hypothetical protein
VLKAKLDSEKIDYEVVEGEEAIREKGFVTTPLLEVDGKVMEFGEAIKWANRKEK